jgi:hypothetical protein
MRSFRQGNYALPDKAASRVRKLARQASDLHSGALQGAGQITSFVRRHKIAQSPNATHVAVWRNPISIRAVWNDGSLYPLLLAGRRRPLKHFGRKRNRITQCLILFTNQQAHLQDPQWSVKCAGHSGQVRPFSNPMIREPSGLILT